MAMASTTSGQWTLDEYLTERNNQRVFIAEFRGYGLRASECLKYDEDSDDLFKRLPPNVAAPHYIIHMECGLRPTTNDRVDVAVCEIVEGFDSLDDGANRAIERWERYEAALKAAAKGVG